MIIEADFDSAELRVLSYLARDEPFLEILRNGGKPHVRTAKVLFGRDVSKDEEEYVFAKSFTYRWFYSHPEKEVTDVGQLRTYRVRITPELLKMATARMDHEHVAIVHWKKERIQALRATGKAFNPMGRYRDLSWATRSHDAHLQEHAEQIALNFPIQGTIGEVMNRAFVRAWDDIEESGLDGRLIIQCHDALLIHCPNEADAPIAAQILRTAIEQPIPELDGLIIPCEIKAGPTWGSVKAVSL